MQNLFRDSYFVIQFPADCQATADVARFAERKSSWIEAQQRIEQFFLRMFSLPRRSVGNIFGDCCAGDKTSFCPVSCVRLSRILIPIGHAVRYFEHNNTARSLHLHLRRNVSTFLLTYFFPFNQTLLLFTDYIELKSLDWLRCGALFPVVERTY